MNTRIKYFLGAFGIAALLAIVIAACVAIARAARKSQPGRPENIRLNATDETWCLIAPQQRLLPLVYVSLSADGHVLTLQYPSSETANQVCDALKLAYPQMREPEGQAPIMQTNDKTLEIRNTYTVQLPAPFSNESCTKHRCKLPFDRESTVAMGLEWHDALGPICVTNSALHMGYQSLCDSDMLQAHCQQIAQHAAQPVITKHGAPAQSQGR